MMRIQHVLVAAFKPLPPANRQSYAGRITLDDLAGKAGNPLEEVSSL